MTGWYITFAVNIALQNLSDAEKTRLSAIINIPGDYSLQHLSLDLNTADVQHFREDLSSAAIGNIPSDPQKDFTNLISGTLQQAVMTTLGYVATSTDAAPASGSTPPPSTFKPTWQAFQTSAWIDPNNPNYTATSGTDGNCRLNYLCYTEMVDNHAAPATAAVPLPSGFNWTDGRAEVGQNVQDASLGTFALSGKYFFEEWFLPKLQSLNQVMEPYMDAMRVTINLSGLDLDTTW